jgi:hypothetical protein
MTLMFGLVVLFVSVAVVAALIVWHPHGPEAARRVGPPPSTLDWCEHIDPDGPCDGHPTHELVGAINTHGDGGGHSAMVATFCAEHAPPGAVRVR